MRFAGSLLFLFLVTMPLQAEIVIQKADTRTMSILREEEEVSGKSPAGYGYRYASTTVSYGNSGAISETIRQAAHHYGVDSRLIEAMVQVESRFEPFAVSRVGAMGLMQLMPETARQLGVANPFDIEENIYAGVRYFKSLYNRFNGNLRLSLAAYNAGPAAVEMYGGVPPYPETMSYVEKIIRLFREAGGQTASGTPLRVERSSGGLVITNETYSKGR
ncbi:MAG TPA: lytic transglycosylase domain-containing protein [Candidatus Mcinerneyibacteriales bacterium]|nr:lytic transglycosylase domain-containing protein [Candidatus Mcinerneyibacteriales bacterium]